MDQQNGGKRARHQQQKPAAAAVYRECLKNHAAALGTHAIDGCGGFIASPSSDPSNPTSITCAACGCHRNFHRRVEPDAVDRGSPNLNHHQREEEDEEDEEEEAEEESRVLLTLKTGGGGPTSAVPAGAGPTSSNSGGERGMRRKRFRSKFSREQKGGMMELAERLGWRLQRREEDAVEEGCRKIGVDRAVFKVWMHNNKQAVLELKKKNNNNTDHNIKDNSTSNTNKIMMKNNGGGGGGDCSSSPSPPN